LKVVHVVRQFSPSVGGLEASVLSLARAQRSQLGIDARVVTLDRVFGQTDRLLSEDIAEGIPVRRLPWRGSSRYPLAPSVLNHLQAADVVHVHAIDFFFDFLALTRPFHGKTIIASTHGGFFHTTKWAVIKGIWFNTVTRGSILAYRRIVASSHSDADLFRKLAGRRLTLIENGIDQARFAGAAAAVQTKSIICFGRFAEHKRIDRIFSLLAHLRAQDPEWRLILAGRDADQTAQQLVAMAEEAGVTDSLRVAVNPSDADLRSLIGEASYFACLSAYEGFGLAAVEAMSAGLFPILSGIAPFRRLVGNSGIGLIVDPDDPATAAATVQATVLEDEAAYTKRQAQTTDAVRQYDWERVATQYAKIYDEAVGLTGRALTVGSLRSGA
jgi:alpha-1,3-mannosyltransferase